MKKYLNKTLFLILGLSLAATASYLNAWSGPTSGQGIVNGVPSGNVAAPVNLSELPQVKLGGLSVASLLSTGAIGASQYCDVNGQNCSTPPFGGSSVPAGTVAAFNLATCPAGWKPSDGTNGTVDLRGVFIRGMESFDGGITSTTTDPDRTGNNTLGTYQNDEFKSHSHNEWYLIASPGLDQGNYYSGAYGPTSATGGSETRPKNRAMIFCQKDGTSSGGGGGTTSSDPLQEFKNVMGISNFPSHVVCKIGGDANFRDVYNLQNVDIANDRVTYNEQGTNYVTYSRATGARTSGTSYCPSQLSLNGSLTQL